MTDIRHDQTVAAMNFSTEDKTADWAWGPVGGRWSVAHAMSVLAGLSLTLWVGVLIVLLW